MIEKYILDWFVNNYIKLLKKYHSDWTIDLLSYLKNDFRPLKDGYNYKCITYPFIILDNYGDDDPTVLMTTNEYNDDKFWKELKQIKKPLNEVRLDVLTSVCLVDTKLNCYLIDIKYDYSYNIKTYYSKLNTEISFETLTKMIRGKRSYYWYNNLISLRFNSEFEEYLKLLGYEKENGREDMLTTHRFIISEPLS